MAVTVGGLASSQLWCHNLRIRHSALTLSWGKKAADESTEMWWGRESMEGSEDSDACEPLSISDIVAALDDGAKVQISYKGIPGSYSEDAALKAYPNCETVSCNDFEEAFKAVEIWWADKVILPIENTSGGSIQRNYDLLLCHRLHIVGEVQLATNLSLLALPGIRTEYLKRVLSHSQAKLHVAGTFLDVAFELSDDFLTKLGVARENVDDTAGAAQIIASNGLYDAGAIASIRAAEICGLNASMTEPRAQTALGHLQHMIKWDKFAYKNSNDNWQKHFLQAMNGAVPKVSEKKQEKAADALLHCEITISNENIIGEIKKETLQKKDAL
ncbi:hypothetical protein JHK84_038194 [Glycine max]|nr:hypothetical protein JHK85_038536 [Glycine max]KAG4978504.1 hypothetical protein JHK86_037978 [Glycine max]KAG5131797.1 hypothetical protein JHK84_038194 [Glycine max]